MQNYLQLVQKIIKNTQNLKPHLKYDNICQIPFEKLKQNGIKILVFDKDNTLTRHLQDNYYSMKVKQTIEENCKKVFSNTELFLVSNSSHKLSSDQELTIQKNLGIVFLSRIGKKKPFNHKQILSNIAQIYGNQINPNQIAFIGDRLLTDVLLANLNGSVSILVQPFDTKEESFGIFLFRLLEKFIQYNQNYSLQPLKIIQDLQNK